MIKAIRATTFALMCMAFLGCGGETQDTQGLAADPDPKGKGNGVVCADINAPVCSVKLQNIQCITTPCPIGVHKTFANRCESDAAGARFLFEDVCGDLEGQPYHEEDEPVACTKEYRPVCAAETTREPCTTLPCPAVRHTSFGNECMARAAKAHIVKEGECGELEGTPVTHLEGGCVTVYDPVCGKDEGQIACITEPCPTHQYKTFGNACEADLALAAVVSTGECGNLEGTVAFGEPPVKIVETLPTTTKQVKVDKVRFDGDRLFVTLGYSGCSPQHFDLYVSDLFMESDPVRVRHAFIPMVEDSCLAYFTTDFVYDLIPLKRAYQEMYRQEHDEIIIPGIGTYEF